MVDQKYSIPVRRVELLNNNSSPITTDAVSRALVAIDHTHHEIHEGDAFACHVASLDIADTASVAIVFKTPDTAKWIHMFVRFTTKAAGHLKILENATWVASTGAEVAVINRNRNSSTTTVMETNHITVPFAANGVAMKNPTGLTGTEIGKVYAFAAKTGGGSEKSEDNELVLKQNTKYAYIYKADAATNGVQIILDWYEHTNKP